MMTGTKRVKRPTNVRQGYKRQREENARNDPHAPGDQPRQPDRKHHEKKGIDPNGRAFNRLKHRFTRAKMADITESNQQPHHGLAPVNLTAVRNVVSVGVPNSPLACLHHLTGKSDPIVGVIIDEKPLARILGRWRRPLGLERPVKRLKRPVPLDGPTEHQENANHTSEYVDTPRPLHKELANSPGDLHHDETTPVVSRQENKKEKRDHSWPRFSEETDATLTTQC